MLTRISKTGRASVCAIAVVSAVLAACSADTEKQQDLEVVRIARSSLLTNAPIAIGDDEGYFAREGIRLQYVEVPSVTVQALPGLQEGDVDVVSSVVSIGLINAVSGGATFKIVADRGHLDPSGCDSFGIIGRGPLFGDKPLDSALLRGRRVSTNVVGQSGYLMSLFLAKYGLDLSDIELVRIPPNVEPSAMDNGSIDIVTRGDPHLSTLLDHGHRLLSSAKTLSPGSHLAVVVFGPTLLVQNRALGVRFMKGYLRAVRKYSEGRTPRNIEIISRRLGLDSAALMRMCWPVTRPDGAINLESIAEYERWAVKGGNLSKLIPPASLVDTTFATRASKELDAEAK
jgi:ABC-type nitrate/sulfonate/bicarbonate transport system substrate-binding protein